MFYCLPLFTSHQCLFCRLLNCFCYLHIFGLLQYFLDRLHCRYGIWAFFQIFIKYLIPSLIDHMTMASISLRAAILSHLFSSINYEGEEASRGEGRTLPLGCAICTRATASGASAAPEISE